MIREKTLVKIALFGCLLIIAASTALLVRVNELHNGVEKITKDIKEVKQDFEKHKTEDTKR